MELIDTAPRDGSVISARDHAGNQSTCAWKDGHWRISFPAGSLLHGMLGEGQPFNAVLWEAKPQFASETAQGE